MARQVEYVDDAFPDRLAVERFVNRHRLDVQSLGPVKPLHGFR